MAINVNNTRTGIGLFDASGRLEQSFSLPTAGGTESYEKALSELKPDARVVCASVVPSATRKLAKFLAAKGHSMEILAPRDDLDISFGGVNYTELGADLYANAVAVRRTWKRDSLTVDLGTGSTFCVVKQGVYLGTTIVPGMELSLRALTDRAALLSTIELAKPSRIISTNTVECLQSGIYYGYIELVRGMIARIQKEQGKLFVVLTGGIGSFLRAELEDVVDVFDPHLTLQGIKCVADSVQKLPLYEFSD